MGATFQIRIPSGNPNQRPLPDQDVRSPTLVSNTFRCTSWLLVFTAMSTSLEDVVARFGRTCCAAAGSLTPCSSQRRKQSGSPR